MRRSAHHVAAVPAPARLTMARGEAALDGAVMAGWGMPYHAATGTALTIDPAGFDRQAVIDMVDDGATRWDICEATAADCALLGKAGLLTAMDWAHVDRNGFAPEFAVPWWGVPAYIYATVLAFDRAALGGEPGGWVDLWNARRPGRRIIPAATPQGVLEAVLLGDGVAPDRLYPLDMARAFARLSAMRASVLLARGEAEAATLLAAGAGSMAILRNTTAQRLRAATGGRIDFIWAQPVVAAALWMVPKEPPGGPAAMNFIGRAQRPALETLMLDTAGCGPANPAARTALHPERRALDPVAHAANGARIDTGWYEGNLEWLTPRWTAFATA